MRLPRAGAPTVGTLIGDKFAGGLLDRYLGWTGYGSQQTRQPQPPTPRRTSGSPSTVRTVATTAPTAASPGSMEALDAAEAALTRGAKDDPAWMYEFDYPRLTAVRGDCLLRLDRPADAERAFQQALAERTHRGGRFEVELLTGMATATARQGRVEEACALGMRSLDLAAADSELGLSRVRQLRRELDRWHDSDEVATLDARLAVA